MRPRKPSKADLRWKAVREDPGLLASIKEFLSQRGQGVDPRDNTTAHYQTASAILDFLDKEGRLGPLSEYRGRQQRLANLATHLKNLGYSRELSAGRRVVQGYEADVYQLPSAAGQEP